MCEIQKNYGRSRDALDRRKGFWLLLGGMKIGKPNVEWSDEILILVDDLTAESEERSLNREERAIVDVVETVELLQEGEGLHDFWQSGLDHSRMINSFDLIGASGMVDVLNASQWCQTRSEDRGQYNETETSHLASIEEEMDDALTELNELVGDFIAEELS